MKKTPPALDRIVDVVLAYQPKPKTKAQKKRARKAVREQQPYCPSCHKRGVPVLCWICKMQMCLGCAKPHGAKSVCERCLRTL